MSYVKIGVAGPVGSGKTALIEALSRKMANDYSIGVITNDIYTKEDAQFLAKNSVLPVERIIGVETGGCPEDCGYCPQAARYDTGVEASKLMEPAEVLAAAKADSKIAALLEGKTIKKEIYVPGKLVNFVAI